LIVRKLVTSLLFVPADDLNKVEKLWSIDAPAFVLDLEDAVASSRKRRAREIVIDQLARVAESDGSRELYVRINAVDTALALGDVLAVTRPGLAGIQIPKVNAAADLQKVDWAVSQLELERGLPHGAIALIALLESARGLENALEIAQSTPRLTHLTFGAQDLAVDLGIDSRPSGATSEYTALITTLKTRLVVASAAAGINPPQEGVFADFRDLDGLRRASQTARSMGFFGQYAIHPAQIGVIEEVFSPREEDVQWAERVVNGFARSEAEGNAATVIDGEFVDYAIAARAQRVLTIARRNPGPGSP
jgi:citrate lyase subunit beta/citryl-CoA lyase